MIGAISPVSIYTPAYATQRSQKTANVWQRPASNGSAVEPVEPVRSTPQVNENQRTLFNQQLPTIREGADPVEMSVRMRIQYVQPGEEADAPQLPNSATQDAAQTLNQPGSASQESAVAMNLPGAVNSEDENGNPAETENPMLESDAALGASDVQKAAEEGKCQTCEERKYQDGSDDPGVSFKSPTNVAPEQAASAVRGHEMEHVVREQSKAQREDRKVVSQSVTYHTGICPECGKAYVSGGTTRTVTAANNDAQAQQQSEQQKNAQQNNSRVPFSAVA